jgi:pyruvate formate lyase activating enzyme
MDEERNMVPIIGVARHRLAVDGQGVTTLVAFHGCTLRCQYCLNAQCLKPDGFSRTATPAELLDEVMIDNLYFLATGGGITFGGGEPAIRSEFIDAFCRMAPPEWHFTIETALNVECHHLERLLPHIHEYYIDIKDLNPDIYRRYTGQDNQRTLDNLQWLLGHDGMADRIVVRVPHIPDFNTDEDVQRSRQYLESIGITRIDEFAYLRRADK